MNTIWIAMELSKVDNEFGVKNVWIHGLTCESVKTWAWHRSGRCT